VRRRAPRPIANALAAFTAAIEPATTLAVAQAAWTPTVGDAIAAHCSPVAERAGVLEVVCDESVWAAELELLGPDLVARLSALPGLAEIAALRCRTGRP
jgi:predicted nucleic acid-binding Zn ribbon protein